MKTKRQRLKDKKKTPERRSVRGCKVSRPDLPGPFMLVCWEHISLCALLRAEASTFVYLTICKVSCNQMR